MHVDETVHGRIETLEALNEARVVDQRIRSRSPRAQLRYEPHAPAVGSAARFDDVCLTVCGPSEGQTAHVLMDEDEPELGRFEARVEILGARGSLCRGTGEVVVTAHRLAAIVVDGDGPIGKCDEHSAGLAAMSVRLDEITAPSLHETSGPIEGRAVVFSGSEGAWSLRLEPTARRVGAGAPARRTDPAQLLELLTGYNAAA